jgi:murein DD-endopeptidase MepM/ murein hydrolase activator NlpD
MTPFETLLLDLINVKVIDSTIPYSEYAPLDLSFSNQELNKLNIADSYQFETYIENLLAKNKAKVAYGGYNEIRNLYKRSTVFNDLNTEERNIHIGLDFWIKAGTPVLAALDGIVHSFQYNNNLGDYGPTIILQHHLGGQKFYSLYGHLSLDSIASIKVGDFFEKGHQLATLGSSSVNGDYAPHLHFQLIKDIKENYGDYPGVSSINNLDYYQENCPDPNLLLKIR